MKRIIFGRRAVKKTKTQEERVRYSLGSIVLGYLYKEKSKSIEFRLPNGAHAICSKEYMRNEMETAERNREGGRTGRIFVHEHKKEMYVELLVLGESKGKYECTFFVQKTAKVHTLLTGFVEQEEEMGYTVQIGMAKKKALLKTKKQHRIGELGVYQVKSVGAAAYILTEEIDREIYIGEKSEIYPGLMLRVRITGRPRHIVGEKKHAYTRMPYRYTGDALGVCAPIVESAQEMEKEDEVTVIIVYVSEERDMVHAMPYSEYVAEIEKKIPRAELLGQKCEVRVLDVKEKYALVEWEEEKVRGIVMGWHYSDVSTDKSIAMFAKDEKIQAKVLAVAGYEVVFTAKESMIESTEMPPYSVGSVVTCVVKSWTEKGVKCEGFGGALIGMKKFANEEIHVGKVYRVEIIKKGTMSNTYLARRYVASRKESSMKETKERSMQSGHPSQSLHSDMTVKISIGTRSTGTRKI